MCRCSPPMSHRVVEFLVIHSPKGKSNWKNNNNMREVERNEEVTGDGRRQAHTPKRAAKLPSSDSHATSLPALSPVEIKTFCMVLEMKWKPTGEAYCVCLLLSPPSRCVRWYHLSHPPPSVPEVDWHWVTAAVLLVVVHYYYFFIFPVFSWLLFLRVWAYPPFPYYASVMFPAQTFSDMVVAGGIPSKVGIMSLVYSLD